MSKRKQISTRSRFEIFKRDEFRCQYCGKTPPLAILHVDHILAVANGGTNCETNLTTACSECNSGKSAVPLGVVVMVASKEWRDDQAEKHEQLLEYNKWLCEVRRQKSVWMSQISNVWVSVMGDNPDEFEMSGPAKEACQMFLDRLPVESIISAIYITDAKSNLSPGTHKFFKYFCAVCWRTVRGDNKP